MEVVVGCLEEDQVNVVCWSGVGSCGDGGFRKVF